MANYRFNIVAVQRESAAAGQPFVKDRSPMLERKFKQRGVARSQRTLAGLQNCKRVLSVILIVIL